MTAAEIQKMAEEWPKDATGRLVCHVEKPLPKELHSGFRCLHPSAVSVEGCSDYHDRYKCPGCGLTFSVELPD